MGLIQRARKAMANKPLLTTRANGSEYVNPLLRINQQLETELMKLSEILGLTRAKRQGVVDPLDGGADAEQYELSNSEIPNEFGDLIPFLSAEK